MNKNTLSKKPAAPRKRKAKGQSTAAFAGGVAAIGSVGALGIAAIGSVGAMIGAGLHKLFTLA